MALWTVYVGIFCLCVLATSVASQKTCDDIDTSACTLMLAQRPGMCSDPTLSQTVCPRFCKLCPVECYHCNTTVLDYHECNTTILCNDGEVCMWKELKSSVDGHHEYKMTCERKELCDGTGVSFPFGRRDIESRDIYLTCCSEDLCNYPETACKRDIIFVVDESDTMINHRAELLDFLSNVVGHLPIGHEDSLVSMATFATSATQQWDLNTYMDKQILQTAIKSIQFNGGNSNTNNALLSVMHTHVGDRPEVQNDIILITDGYFGYSALSKLLADRVHQTSNDVIAIGIGNITDISELTSVATDSGHMIKVGNVLDLPNLQQKLIDLLCL